MSKPPVWRPFRGVTFGGSGVSIGGVGSLRAFEEILHIFRGSDAGQPLSKPCLKNSSAFLFGYSTNPPKTYPPRNKGLIAGLIKGNQWLKALFLGGGSFGGGTLDSHENSSAFLG